MLALHEQLVDIASILLILSSSFSVKISVPESLVRVIIVPWRLHCAGALQAQVLSQYLDMPGARLLVDLAVLSRYLPIQDLDGLHFL